VGKISYAVRYQIWEPAITDHFPSEFRRGSAAFVNESLYSNAHLPVDIIKMILSFCPPNWFKKSSDVIVSKRPSCIATLSAVGSSILTAIKYDEGVNSELVSSEFNEDATVPFRYPMRWACNIS
jgi:hypothetical protein